MIPEKEDIVKAVSFKTSRSGGKGGQNVNKVSSKVELIMNIETADCFTDEEKALLTARLAQRLDQEGNLHIVSQEDRSQLVNKARSLAKLMVLLNSALHIDKKRKATKTPRATVLKRKSDKQSLSAKKQNRRKPAREE